MGGGAGASGPLPVPPVTSSVGYTNRTWWLMMLTKHNCRLNSHYVNRPPHSLQRTSIRGARRYLEIARLVWPGVPLNCNYACYLSRSLSVPLWSVHSDVRSRQKIILTRGHPRFNLGGLLRKNRSKTRVLLKVL